MNGESLIISKGRLEKVLIMKNRRGDFKAV